MGVDSIFIDGKEIDFVEIIHGDKIIKIDIPPGTSKEEVKQLILASIVSVQRNDNPGDLKN